MPVLAIAMTKSDFYNNAVLAECIGPAAHKQAQLLCGGCLSVTTKALENFHPFDLGDSTSLEFILTKYKDEKKYLYTKVIAEMLFVIAKMEMT